jgi:ribose transport system permease protein
MTTAGKRQAEPAATSVGTGGTVAVKHEQLSGVGRVLAALHISVSTLVAAVAFIAMIIFFTIKLPGVFLTTGTLKDVLNQSVVPIILASGLTLVLSAGEFDLTNTATVGLSSAILAVLIAYHGASVLVACVMAVLAGIVIGLVAGSLVAFSNAHSFIVTLALGSAITGVELTVSGNTTIFQNIPPSFSNLTGNSFLGINQAVWIAGIIVIGTTILLHGTRFGRHVQAIGGNSEAAYLAGVPIRRVIITCYVLLSIFAGIVAIIMVSRAVTYNPEPATGFLLSTYAAVFLGAAVAGRKLHFSMPGTIFGVLVLIVFGTGLTQLNQPTAVTNLAEGIVLTIAVVSASRSRKR